MFVAIRKKEYFAIVIAMLKLSIYSHMKQFIESADWLNSENHTMLTSGFLSTNGRMEPFIV